MTTKNLYLGTHSLKKGTNDECISDHTDLGSYFWRGFRHRDTVTYQQEARFYYRDTAQRKTVGRY